MKIAIKLVKKLLAHFGLKVFRSKNEPWGLDLYNDLSRLTSLDEFKIVFDVGANVGQSRDLYL
jgi:hypothetical protein